MHIDETARRRPTSFHRFQHARDAFTHVRSLSPALARAAPAVCRQRVCNGACALPVQLNALF